jgi:4-hydroxythreonine-4-phosphate dehydrogenase
LEGVGDRFDAVLVGPEDETTWSGEVSLPARRWVPDVPQNDDAAAGRVCAEAIERAVALAMDGRVDAVVTAPIHKPSLHAAGYDFPGHTEMLQALTKAPHVGMLMAAERTLLGAPLRVLLATTHVALARVPQLFTSELLFDQATLLARALQNDWGISAPRIALCAFNPHASDGGLFGDEEARLYAPAIERLRSRGIDVTGPVPADTVFQRAINGSFDAVVAPYHDVGMAAFKTICFGTGVNVTLGLPFVRTSPDHGTAFDLAGTGRANPSSMGEALDLAVRLAGTRFDRGSARV